MPCYSAWADVNQLALSQVATAEKSNEITAIPKLLELLELAGCIVILDAMGCQKAIAEQTVAQGADYVLAVRENQPHLHAAIVDYFETAEAAQFQAVPVRFIEQTDVGHGPYEVRRYWLANDLSTLPDPGAWAGLRGIGMVETERHQGGRVSRKRRYYITTPVGDVQAFAKAVRIHWGVENRLHWVLDVTFREDESRIRRANAPANFNTLRQFALNLLRCTRPAIGIKQKRLRPPGTIISALTWCFSSDYYAGALISPAG